MDGLADLIDEAYLLEEGPNDILTIALSEPHAQYIINRVQAQLYNLYPSKRPPGKDGMYYAGGHGRLATDVFTNRVIDACEARNLSLYSFQNIYVGLKCILYVNRVLTDSKGLPLFGNKIWIVNNGRMTNTGLPRLLKVNP